MLFTWKCVPVVREKSGKLTSLSHARLLRTCSAGRVDDWLDNLSLAYVVPLLKDFRTACASFTVFSSTRAFKPASIQSYVPMDLQPRLSHRLSMANKPRKDEYLYRHLATYKRNDVVTT